MRKNYLILCFALVMTLGLAGCGEKDNAKDIDFEESIQSDYNEETNENEKIDEKEEIDENEVSSIHANEVPETEYSLYEVSAENVADILGLWRDSSGQYELSITSCLYNIFNDLAYYEISGEDFCFSGCISGNTYSDGSICLYDYEGNEPQFEIVFAEEGIYIKDMEELNMKECLFTRPGLYGSEPVGQSDYTISSSGAFYVMDQITSNGRTFFFIRDEEFNNWIMYMDEYIDERFNGYYFISNGATIFPNLCLKGYSVCNLSDFSVMSWEDYNNSPGGNTNDYSVNNYGNYEIQCPFPRDYDTAVFDANTGLWIVANTTVNHCPIKFTGVEILEWNANIIDFVGRLQNTGSESYSVNVNISLCDADGYIIKSNKSYAIYYDQGYYITDSYLQAVENAKYYLEPNQEGLVFLDYYDNPSGNYGIDIGDITRPISYIYIELNYYDKYSDEW